MYSVFWLWTQCNLKTSHVSVSWTTLILKNILNHSFCTPLLNFYNARVVGLYSTFEQVNTSVLRLCDVGITTTNSKLAS